MKVLVLALVFLPNMAFPFEFPEKFVRCHLNDSDLDNCLRSSIENAIHLIGTKGIPSLHLLPIDPIRIDEMEAQHGLTVNLRQKYTNITMHGGVNSKVEKAHFNLATKVLTFTVFFPKLQQKAKYEVEGNIFVLPVYGSGDSIITMENIRMTQTLSFKEERRDGNVYFKLKSFKLKIKLEKVHFDFDNLFNGDKLLADNIARVVNENGLELYYDYIDFIEKIYGAALYKTCVNFFKNVPIKFILMQ